jgi:S-adenosylmethionine synthetase
LGFAIGEPKPISIHIETFGTNKVDMNKLYSGIEKTFDMNLVNIVKELNLTNPIYSKLSVFGHFGREELNLP